MIITPEKEVLAACIEFLQYEKKVALAWRNNSGVMFSEYNGKKRCIKLSPTGTSDIVGLLADGRFLAIETKSRETKHGVEISAIERLSDVQLKFFHDVIFAGGVAFAVASVAELEKDFKNVILKKWAD